MKKKPSLGSGSLIMVVRQISRSREGQTFCKLLHTHTHKMEAFVDDSDSGKRKIRMRLFSFTIGLRAFVDVNDSGTAVEANEKLGGD